MKALSVVRTEQQLGSENQKWFTTEEAANYLRVGKKTLLNLTSNGQVPYSKFGRRNRYLESDLNRLLMIERRGLKWE